MEVQGNMKKVFVLVTVLIFLGSMVILPGCVSLRGAALDLSREDLANAEVSREVAKNMIETWAINSGFMRAYLGNRINEMPVRFTQALDMLDEMYDNRHTLTDLGLGAVLGLRLRLVEETIRECIKDHAPELLRYLP